MTAVSVFRSLLGGPPVTLGGGFISRGQLVDEGSTGRDLPGAYTKRSRRACAPDLEVNWST